MPLVASLWDLTGGAILVRVGAAGRLTTLGRASGQPRTVQCGFLQRADGTVLVGSAEGRQWPRNLAAAGWCTFEARGLPKQRYRARQLDGAQRDRAISDFREARGERAAKLFTGRVFELSPEGE